MSPQNGLTVNAGKASPRRSAFETPTKIGPQSRKFFRLLAARFGGRIFQKNLPDEDLRLPGGIPNPFNACTAPSHRVTRPVFLPWAAQLQAAAQRLTVGRGWTSVTKSESVPTPV